MTITRNRVAGAIAALVVAGGAVFAGAMAANAANGGSSTGNSSSTGNGPSHDGDRSHDGGAPGETAVTGADLATAKAAALKAVPGGTVDRVESDSGDAAYEAHMTKSDGSEVTVKFDKNFAVTGVEDGMGR